MAVACIADWRYVAPGRLALIYRLFRPITPMTNPLDTVQAFYTSFAEKDWAKLRTVLTDDFTFRGAMAQFDSPDAYVEGMRALPFEGEAEDSRFMVTGGQVAHAFTWKMTAPMQARIPMCEVLEVDGGKVRRSELYYDSAAMPAPQ